MDMFILGITIGAVIVMLLTFAYAVVSQKIRERGDREKIIFYNCEKCGEYKIIRHYNYDHFKNYCDKCIFEEADWIKAKTFKVPDLDIKNKTEEDNMTAYIITYWTDLKHIPIEKIYAGFETLEGAKKFLESKDLEMRFIYHNRELDCIEFVYGFNKSHDFYTITPVKLNK